ncbi:hypothetical protein H8B06_00360 [Sphingobacterium sp. DN00404]|uniref:Alpha/beta hydrolase n=1 Tax=Sphingobacterium micropteri TaxID=2763501 RepID=A0ABR7YJ97_9SPHI|nr:hypothetical protein [Sphingobacterium micropteri]MBD1431263.1 hypothetical protein [Sphingobacterium micropteri]
MQAKATEYQWSVSVPGYISEETKNNPRAFLWIPEDCVQVKAVVFSQQNMCEETIFEHPSFRKTMAELGFAIVWIAPGIDYPWDETKGLQEIFNKILNDLAEVSGYTEVKHAPLVPLGHSAMATFPWNFAAWNPGRTLAVVSYKGDAPRTNLTGYGRENLEWGRNRNIDGIPGLMIEGEYEWWEARVNPALAFRMMYPESCVSFLCDRGQGHFDVSDKVVDYINLFLRKAAQYRLPESQPLEKPMELKKINPTDGWLVGRWEANAKREKGAPFNQYKGNKHDAFWYFDQEIAQATEDYYREIPNRKLQYISFLSGGKWLNFKKENHSQYELTPEINDKLTFNLSAVYSDENHVQLSGNHAKEKIVIHKVNGPIEKLNDTTFALQFYRTGFNNIKRTGGICLVAQSPGDEKYKSAVQQIYLKIPYPLNQGERQYILFPGLPDVGQQTKEMKLNATSDKNLTVSYYIQEGPAKIEGDKVILTKIPPRARFPIKVTVVAWQYGVNGKIQSAQPVERSFYIKK